jgi:general secretion pathway protein H
MSRTGDRTSPQGFTLIEVAVVLALLALITAMIVPLMSGSQAKADVQSAAREISAALRMTRNLAMVHGHTEAFVIDTASGSFRAGSGTAPKRVPGGVQLLLVTATSERIDGRTGGIRFFADGSSTGGGVQLAKGNSRGQVLVDWLTGRVYMGDGGHAAIR